MEDLTQKQLEIEKKYNDIVKIHENGSMSFDEANDKLDKIVKYAIFNKHMSQSDQSHYNNRRDDKGSIRSHLQFALYMRWSHRREKETFAFFIEWAKRTGKKLVCKPLGSDEKGDIFLFNVGNRREQPSKPDYVIILNNTKMFLEVKNFGKKEIWLKLTNLKRYYNEKSRLLIGFRGEYYIFKDKAVDHIMTHCPTVCQLRFGKESIIISMDGKEADFSLLEMIKLGQVERLRK